MPRYMDRAAPQGGRERFHAPVGRQPLPHRAHILRRSLRHHDPLHQAHAGRRRHSSKMFYSSDPDIVIRAYLSHGPGAFAYVIDLLLNFMLQLLYAGFVIFVLNMIRRQANSFGTSWTAFSTSSRSSALTSSAVSLCFSGPAFRHSRHRRQLPLPPGPLPAAGPPEMGIMECIRESKRLMRGHKAELFVLDLSFIGWALLSIIPFVSVYTLPYTESTYALYYDQLRRFDAEPGPGEGNWY